MGGSRMRKKILLWILFLSALVNLRQLYAETDVPISRQFWNLRLGMTPDEVSKVLDNESVVIAYYDIEKNNLWKIDARDFDTTYFSTVKDIVDFIPHCPSQEILVFNYSDYVAICYFYGSKLFSLFVCYFNNMGDFAYFDSFISKQVLKYGKGFRKEKDEGEFRVSFKKGKIQRQAIWDDGITELMMQEAEGVLERYRYYLYAFTLTDISISKEVKKKILDTETRKTLERSPNI